MSRRKGENRNPDPVEVLARSVCRCHKAGIRQIGDLLCQASMAGTGFFSVLDHLLSWWRHLSGLFAPPFHLDTTPGKPVPAVNRPVSEHQPSIPAYSDIQIWSSLYAVSGAVDTVVWNNFHHTPGLSPFPGIQGLVGSDHPVLLEEPASARVPSKIKPLQDRLLAPSFASTVSSYTRIAILSREFISSTLHGHHGDGARYKGPRPGKTVVLETLQSSAPTREGKQKEEYMEGGPSRTTIAMKPPLSGNEPRDEAISESITPVSQGEPAGNLMPVREILAQSAWLHAWYRNSGILLSRNVFQGLVTRDIQISREARDARALPDQDGNTRIPPDYRPEMRSEGIFRFLFSYTGDRDTLPGLPMLQYRFIRGDVSARRPDVAEPAATLPRTPDETRTTPRKVISYRVGVPNLSPRKESLEELKGSPEPILPGLDTIAEIISPLIPPQPAGIVPSRQTPEVRISRSETTHPLSILISPAATPGFPLATGPWTSPQYHSALREVLERVRTVEIPIRRIMASARSFSDRQDSALREMVTLMSFPAREIIQEGPARTTQSQMGPSMVTGRALLAGYASAVFQAPGMTTLTGPRPSLSPPPSVRMFPGKPSFSTSSLTLERNFHHSPPAPSGTTNHFHNDFHITVQVRDTSDERELRDLGRKIGRVLSDELARYGGVL
jgi:hypothetical protein